jgi:hypothetical protein
LIARDRGGGMAETIYDDLLRTGQELLQFRGFLDTQEQKAQLKVQNSFNSQRNKIVYDLLHRVPNADDARGAVSHDFNTIRADTPDHFAGVVDYVEDELFNRIEAEGRKSPLHRRVIRWTPVAVGAIIVAFYFGMRLYAALPIDRPIDAREGIEQRAAAFKKVMRHQEWTDTRRHRLVAELLAWPISPTETESKGAAEFAGLVLGGRSALAQSKAICGAPDANAPIDDADIRMVDGVADYIRQPNVKWLTPPAFTLLRPIQDNYPCR